MSSELWLFKKENITNLSISKINSIYGQNKQTAHVHNQSHPKGWARFDISYMLNDGNVSTLFFEVSSADAEVYLDLEGDRKPFLLNHVVDSKKRHISKREAIDCANENSICCRQLYNVSMKDIGWDSWIIEPQEFEANYCTGRCTNDVRLPINNYGQLFMALCDRNPQKAREIGKTECIRCSPKAYAPKSVAYYDSNHDRVVLNMVDMIVTECGCI